MERSIKKIFEEGKYIVPLYQRNYAWRKEEIEQLLQDVYEAYKKNPSGNYFIGSLVVLKRQNGDFEVIDGQQRLTTLSLITKILGISKSPCLFYDSRPEVEEFFKEFYSKYNVESDEFNTEQELKEIDYPQTVHLKNAIDFILEANLEPDGKIPLTIQNMTEDKKQFIDYFSDHVILIRVEIPGDTDVASYFEIMNNRGVQLKKHEILKSLLMTKLSTEVEQVEFAKIWDACSQMDAPIQRLFNAEDRKKYFGESYDEFNYAFPESTLPNENKWNNSDDKNCYCIDEILSPGFNKGNTNNSGNNNNDEEEEECSEYKSIIDFPNFLMHVLKIQYNDYFKSSAVKTGDFENEKNDIPLNEKYLLSVYDKIKDKVDEKEFIKLLFYCRVVFDRYIIKTIIDENEEDEIRWTLRKPRKNGTNWRFCDTFGKTTDEESSEKNFEQNRIIKALSMLQVTFRSRIYKNWLYEVLNWFWTIDEGKTINVTFEEYSKKLDGLIHQYYIERKIDTEPSDKMYSLGTNTPHFIFNFIDYLYWVDSKNTERINQKYKIKDFDFKYWNSVEHHLARGFAERKGLENKDGIIDSLGNLCLINKSTNSRLSDRGVKEKVLSYFGDNKINMGPKRRIMYEMTKNNDWDIAEIKKHYDDVMELIKNHERILGINQ